MTRDKANTIGNKELTRRSFVGGIASTAVAVGLGRCDLLAKNTPSTKKAERSRPNVLLIVADQHNADVMGNAGHPVVKTLEFLAELVDLYPTLMDLLDLKRPKDAPELPGKSLISSLTENKPTGRKYAISENWSQSTVITERYKLDIWIDFGPIDKYKRRDNRQRDLSFKV